MTTSPIIILENELKVVEGEIEKLTVQRNLLVRLLRFIKEETEGEK